MNFPLVVIGNQSQNHVLSFSQMLENATELCFSIAPEQDQNSPNPMIMIDQKRTKWNIFGETVEGSRSGSKLIQTISFIVYWFS